MIGYGTLKYKVSDSPPIITGPSGEAGFSFTSKSISENSTAVHTVYC